MLVVADTSPINYLILINAVDVLPKIFGRIVIPPQVLGELRHLKSPQAVREWAMAAPLWLEVLEPGIKLPLPLLDAGETAAINLAVELHADTLLIDERLAREAAENQGIVVTGTLAILRDAAVAGLIELSEVLERLQRTTFRASPAVYAAVFSGMKEFRPPQSS